MANKIVELTPQLQRAVDTLNNAKTSAEILDARNIAHNTAEAAKEAERRLRVTKAAQAVITACREARVQALDIENQANFRIANEYDAAQERGEVATPGSSTPRQGRTASRNVPNENISSPTVTDIGLTRKEVHEARQIRDAETKEPGAIRKALDAEVASGKSPRRATITETVKRVNAKPKTQPKPKSEPKKSRRAETLENVDKVRDAIHDDIEAGRPISRDKIAEDLDVAERAVRDGDLAERYYQKGRKDVLEELAAGKIEALSLTTQQKLEVHKRLLDTEHRRRMTALEIEAKRAEAEFQKRVDAQVRADCDSFVLPSYTKELNQQRAALEAVRKGAFTATQYRDLLACLHPDRIPDDQPAMKQRYTETFQRVNELRDTMVKPEEAPLPPSAVPRTYAEMMAAKERVRAQRKAQRQHNTDTPAQRH